MLGTNFEYALTSTHYMQGFDFLWGKFQFGLTESNCSHIPYESF